MEKEEQLLRWAYKEKERTSVERERENDWDGRRERENDGRESITSSQF